MAKLSKSIVIVGAKRTAFGALTGSLKAQSATDLAVHASKAALAQSGILPADIGLVIVGNVQQTSPDAIYCARHVGLRAGIPIEVPAVTVNRLCGSGFEAVSSAVRVLPVARPTCLTSLKAAAYSALSRLGGPANRKPSTLGMANGCRYAHCGKRATSYIGGVGCQFPGVSFGT